MPKLNLLSFVNLFLCLLLVGGLSSTSERYEEVFYETPWDDTDLLRQVETGDYRIVLEYSYRVAPELYDQSPVAQECYHVGQYFENALLYRAYLSHDPSTAETYRQKMDTHRQAITNLTYTIADINSQLELEELSG